MAEIDRNIAANEGFLYISPSFNKRSVEFIDRTKRSRIILNSFKSLLSLARISLAKCSLTGEPFSANHKDGINIVGQETFPKFFQSNWAAIGRTGYDRLGFFVEFNCFNGKLRSITSKV